jgi:hypothetical protein
MRPDGGDRTTVASPKRHEHREQQRSWPAPSATKSAPPSWNNKTMHHPSTRIGEIKHGRT